MVGGGVMFQGDVMCEFMALPYFANISNLVSLTGCKTFHDKSKMASHYKIKNNAVYPSMNVHQSFEPCLDPC